MSWAGKNWIFYNGMGGSINSVISGEAKQMFEKLPGKRNGAVLLQVRISGPPLGTTPIKNLSPFLILLCFCCLRHDSPSLVV